MTLAIVYYVLSRFLYHQNEQTITNLWKKNLRCSKSDRAVPFLRKKNAYRYANLERKFKVKNIFLANIHALRAKVCQKYILQSKDDGTLLICFPLPMTDRFFVSLEGSELKQKQSVTLSAKWVSRFNEVYRVFVIGYKSYTRYFYLY